MKKVEVFLVRFNNIRLDLRSNVNKFLLFHLFGCAFSSPFHPVSVFVRNGKKPLAFAGQQRASKAHNDLFYTGLVSKTYNLVFLSSLHQIGKLLTRVYIGVYIHCLTLEFEYFISQ